MKRFIDWLSSRFSPRKTSGGSNLRQTGTHARQPGSHLKRGAGHTVSRPAAPKQAIPRRQPEFVDLDPQVSGRIEERGPGKNVLVRSKYVREDTGTHETLKILDDSISEKDEKGGFDPYNTGQFDRSRNWDKHTK